MNISSIVIKVLPENAPGLIEKIKASDFCEFHLYEDGNIVVTIEGENTSEEIKMLRQIEALPNVITAQLMYSFCEEELDQERDNLMQSEDFPDWLNNEKLKAEDIKYNGDLRKKMFY